MHAEKVVSMGLAGNWARWLAALGLLIWCSAAWASPFVNLDFEQANVPPGTAWESSLPASSALPGWTPRFGSAIATTVEYDHMVSDYATIVLYDSGYPFEAPPPQGTYYVRLRPELVQDTGATPLSLTQCGDVPLGSRSIQMIMRTSILGGPARVLVDGTDLPLANLGPANYGTLYGADITQFAGENVSLEINSGNQDCFIDAISFSPQVVPEPGLLGLAAACGIVLLGRAARSPGTKLVGL